MTRAVGIEFESALYHVTARGDRREDIYEDDLDRSQFLEILGVKWTPKTGQVAK